MGATDDAIKVSAADFQRSPGLYQEMAQERGPVTITRNGRDRSVLMSAEEYHRLRRRARRVVATGELTDRQVAALRQSKVPDRFAYLDAELSDSKS